MNRRHQSIAVMSLMGVSLVLAVPIIYQAVTGDSDEVPLAAASRSTISRPTPSSRPTTLAVSTPPSAPAPAAPSTTATSATAPPRPVVTEAPATQDRRPPSPISDLRFVGNTATSVSIAWNASTDNVAVDRYLVMVDGTPTVTTAYTHAEIDGVRRDARMLVQVAAIDTAGNRGEWRAMVIVTPPAPSPTVIGGPLPSESETSATPSLSTTPGPSPTPSPSTPTPSATGNASAHPSSTTIPTVTVTPVA